MTRPLAELTVAGRRYHARRAAGMCGNCGKTPPLQGRARCEPCLVTGRERVRAIQQATPIAVRRQQDRVYRERRQATDPHRQRDFARGIRREAITAYGGQCECCGESQFEFLAIDHIYGDGGDERRLLKSNLAILLTLRRNGWPRDRHQLLCHNCHAAKSFYGGCPHMQARTELKVVM